MSENNDKNSPNPFDSDAAPRGKLIKLSKSEESRHSFYHYKYSDWVIPITILDSEDDYLISFGITSLGSGNNLARIRTTLYEADIYSEELSGLLLNVESNLDNAVRLNKKLNQALPSILRKVAIQSLVDGTSREADSELLNLINSSDLMEAFESLCSLPLMNPVANQVKPSVPIRRILNLVVSYRISVTNKNSDTPTQIRTLPTTGEKEKQRELEASAARKLLSVLERGMSDSPALDLSALSLNSPKITNVRKASLTNFMEALKEASSNNLDLVFNSSPLLSEVLKGFIWALENKQIEEPITERSGLDNGDSLPLKRLDTTNKKVRLERSLLDCFESHYGYRPACMWALLEYALGEEINKKSIERKYNQWKRQKGG
ncbi:MAG: hypothetical protein VYD53_02610 [Pseudomonadota bacterium]|nr:hypothetical protein [Pseudomonadota bacterium]